MATIQVVIDEDLLRRMDGELEGSQRARSAFVRTAIERELARREVERLEEEHRQSYLQVPSTEDEATEIGEWAELSAKVLREEPWDGPST